jgi:hypothetical protein
MEIVTGQHDDRRLGLVDGGFQRKRGDDNFVALVTARLCVCRGGRKNRHHGRKEKEAAQFHGKFPHISAQVWPAV